MSRVLTAAEICHRALRAIGKFPVTETAPDPENEAEAMLYLDMILAEAVGTERMFKRFPETLSFDITNGTQDYDLYAELGDDLPTEGLEFVVQAYIEDGNGNRKPLEVVTREKFEDVSKPAETGPVCFIHVDRNVENAPTLRIFPTPPTTDTNTYTIFLVCQRYAPNVSPGGVTGSQPQSSVAHEFAQAWQRWLVFQLADDLGSGPILKLPNESLVNFRAKHVPSKLKLLAFNDREQETTPPICEAWGMS